MQITDIALLPIPRYRDLSFGVSRRAGIAQHERGLVALVRSQQFR